MIIRTAYSYTNETRRAWWPDLRRSNHVYIVGPSGSGKSTAMVNLCHRIAAGEYGEQGFAFLDPHGDTAWEDIVNTIPRQRLEQTIWFDPTDRLRPFGINLVPYAPDNPLAAEHTLEAFNLHLEARSGNRAARQTHSHRAQLPSRHDAV
jgi:hypothetical protein